MSHESLEHIYTKKKKKIIVYLELKFSWAFYFFPKSDNPNQIRLYIYESA